VQPPDDYCTPEMAELMRKFAELLDGVTFVREARLNHPYTGEPLAHWYVPVERDVKAELAELIDRGHKAGYWEGVGEMDKYVLRP
jgi:hypothetical protein